jgi:uncharacterized cupredoxin-like copper-binding protein
MKTKLLFTLGLAALSLGAADTKIKRSALPAPVQQALDQLSQGATIVGYSKEVENGKTLYEIEMKTGSLTKDVTLDETGKVVIVEQEVALDSLPDAVKNGITKAAGASKIVKVESITEGDKVTYEASLKSGKTKELVVGKDGELISNK